jgi:putative serine protease PepD
MPFPDDPDDDAGFIPPLPQDDRLWRHPSEVDGPHSLASARNRRSSRSGLTAFILLLVIAIGTGIAAFGTFHSSGATHDGTAVASGPASHDLSDDVLASLSPAVVQITIDGPTVVTMTTGLMIRPDGHVITASDPLHDARSITVTLFDGRSFNATVVGTDPSDDIGVIDIEASGLTTPVVGDLSSIEQGDTVYVIGRTETDHRSWVASAVFQSSGQRIDATDGTSMHDMITSSLETTPPTPSAVLCTRAGAVIGLFTSRTSASSRTNAIISAPSTLTLPTAHTEFANSIAWATHVADDIIATGVVHRAWLGIISTDAAGGGALIQSVSANSPAEIAGLVSGDLITALGKIPVHNSSDLVVALRRFVANDSVNVEFKRSGSTSSTKVRLTDRT